ncbi:MAG TPA: DoxX family protein [Leptospiraceae bacterium]|nr:DoxX family protein [Spirochaetaceae bacterium]HBS06538.1 DoxX family protein [Leptospiraceae bacterium]|tara:strand:+ start:585 stop:1049 length:465 start_codon:yes stop_codon:yes gene_type:complete
MNNIQNTGREASRSRNVRWFQNSLIGLMSVLFILFGSSKFYPFMPTPPVAPEAGRFMGALLATGYVWQFVGLVEIMGGLLLLYRPTRLIGALLLLPVIAHIVPYLWILARTIPGIPMGLFLIGMEAWILFGYRHRLEWLYISRNEGTQGISRAA